MQKASSLLGALKFKAMVLYLTSYMIFTVHGHEMGKNALSASPSLFQKTPVDALVMFSLLGACTAFFQLSQNQYYIIYDHAFCFTVVVSC